ncbi:hypothetical protein PPBDW_II0722 [Photobacterium kishitanii]|nr:hypothetical protein PPBDW_II0722 [Photobacterium kishitanii]
MSIYNVELLESSENDIAHYILVVLGASLSDEDTSYKNSR